MLNTFQGTQLASRRISKWLIPAFVFVTVAGCAKKDDVPQFHKDLVPISGTIRLKNEPLAGAAIIFSPIGQDAVRPAYALTDSEGKYAVMTPIHGLPAAQTKGAVPGEYKVIISKLVMPDGSPIPAELTQADAMQKGAQESLPAKYSSESQAVLNVTVQKETPKEDVDFTLQ